MMAAMKEGVKLVSSIVESLREHPFVLALVVVDLAMIGLLFYVASSRHEELTAFYKMQQEFGKMLAQCKP